LGGQDIQAFKVSCVAIFEPEIAKLREALKFFKDASEYISTVFTRHEFAKPEARITDIYLRKILKILDCLVVLDKIKSSKKSLEKDFETFRHFLDTSRTGDSNSAENRELDLFLGPVHSIMQKFREVSKTPRYVSSAILILPLSTSCIHPSSSFFLL
jgi:hypothetical protein